MPKHIPTPAIRAAIMATTLAAAALTAALPATTVAAAPAPAAAHVTLTSPVTPVAWSTPALPAPSRAGASAAALKNALSKIGSPYRWGAAGPNAFDCSGLVSWAFKQAGIALPRTSRAMSTVGTPVAKANLRPGDLVFFYRPVSHVGIYVGNGKIVHASTRGTPVKISDMSRMPFNSARRV